MKKICLALSFICLFITSCKRKVNLKNEGYTVLKYEELPKVVKDTITISFLKIFNVKHKDNFFINLNDNKEDYLINFNENKSYGFEGVAPVVVKYNNGDFIFDFSNIEGTKPYVLHKNKLYFGTKLNVYKLQHVIENKYKMIDLSKYLKK